MGFLLAGSLAACGDGASAPAGAAPAPGGASSSAVPAATPDEVRRLLAAGELEPARAAAEALVAASPGSLDALLLQASVLRALHDRPGGQTALEAAYAIAPAGFPALANLVDHKLRGPDDPAKGRAQLAFLDTHLAAHPADTREVAEARLVALSYLLGQATLPPEDRPALVELAERSLAAFPDATTTDGHYNRAQTLLALGRVEESVAAARAGIAVDDDRWEGLVMGWSVALLALHAGDDAAARAAFADVRAHVEGWTGTHFGMGKPLVELYQLTAAVWWGETLPAPADYEARLARLKDSGARLQVGDPESRELLRTILAARAAKDAAAVRTAADDLLGLVARDRGCEMENQVIRPHTRALALVAKADALAQLGDTAGAEAAMSAARKLFPQDPWLKEHVPGR